MERLGIEHIEEREKHGHWFGVNPTASDFALGTPFFGLPFSSIVAALTMENAAGRFRGTGLVEYVDVSNGRERRCSEEPR